MLRSRDDVQRGKTLALLLFLCMCQHLKRMEAVYCCFFLLLRRLIPNWMIVEANSVLAGVSYLRVLFEANGRGILFDFTLAVEFLMCKIVQLAVRCMIGPRAAHPHGHPVALPATIPCIIPKVLQHHCMVVVESERSGHLVRGIECFGVLVD